MLGDRDRVFERGLCSSTVVPVIGETPSADSLLWLLSDIVNLTVTRIPQVVLVKKADEAVDTMVCCGSGSYHSILRIE